MSCKLSFNAVVLILGALHFPMGYADEFAQSEHRTKAATEKLPALVCFRCDTMVDGERCSKLDVNNTTFHTNCSDEARICQVKRISMTSINKTGEALGKPKLWMLQRNCTGSCEPGCIIIGERTKLYSCTTCCEQSYCNVGNSADGRSCRRRFYLSLISSYLFSLMIMST